MYIYIYVHTKKNEIRENGKEVKRKSQANDKAEQGRETKGHVEPVVLSAEKLTLLQVITVL
jgi:hypothetical protein